MRVPVDSVLERKAMATSRHIWNDGPGWRYVSGFGRPTGGSRGVYRWRGHHLGSERLGFDQSGRVVKVHEIPTAAIRMADQRSVYRSEHDAAACVLRHRLSVELLKEAEANTRREYRAMDRLLRGLQFWTWEREDGFDDGVCYRPLFEDA